jgi:hypothetical protein
MKRVNNYRLRAFLPRLETLENRWQPGSLLTTGLDVAALGSALDQNLGSQDNSSVQNQALNLSLGSFNHNQNSGGTVTVTPYQVSHSNTTSTSSLTLTAGSSLNLDSGTQGLGVAGKHLATSQGTTQVTGTGQGSTINSHQQGGAQTSQSNLTPVAAPVQATAVSAAVPSAVGTQSVGLKLTTQTVGDGHHPPYTGFWASLFNNPAAAGSDNAALNKVVQVGGGQTAALYAVGTVNDGSSGFTDIALLATAAGGTTATIATLSSNNPGNATGLSIALDSTGSNLIIGGTVTDSSGNSGGVVASVTTALSTLNWGIGFTGPSSVNGVTDSAGTVSFTGSLGTGSARNVIVGQTDEATGTNTNAFQYQFSVPTAGNGVGIDTNTGNVDVAGAYAGTGVDDPSMFQLPSDLSVASGIFFAVKGAMNGVKVDAGGNAYYAGPVLFAQNGNTIGYIVAKVNPDGQSLSNDYGGFGWLHGFTEGGIPANSPSYDNAIDPAGDNLNELTIDDNSGLPNTHGQLFSNVGPDGQALVEFGDGGINGSNDDYGLGIATDGNGNVYTVGKTNSPDFTTNGFKTMFDAGDMNEGWIGYATTP